MNALADRDFCAALVISLGHFLWQGTLIAGLVALVSRRLKTANARCHVLVAAFCLMAISPFVTLAVRFLVSENNLPSTVAEVQPPAAKSHVAGIGRLPAQSTGPLVPMDVPLGEDLAQLPAVAPNPTAPPIKSSADIGWQRFAPLMMNVYLLGVAAMLLRLVVGVWGGWRLRHRSTPVEEVALLQALRRQAQSLGMKCVPVLAWCESVAVPTVIGILKPTILLPLSLTSGLAADQVESVLAHELAHLRRYDHLVNLFQRVVESLLFFHPAVWWLSNRIRIEREHCCDDMVVACGAVPLDYAKSLLRVAELSRQSRRNRSVSAVSLLATGQPSTLRQRIARLLGDATDTHVRFLHRWPALLLALVCLLVAWTTTRVGWGLPPRPDEKPAPFVAELPGGVKVELLSIGYHQTLMKKWWAADGTVLPAEPRDPKLKRVEFSSFTGGSLQGEAREIAVRITGIPKQETFFGYQFCWEPYGDAVSNAVVYEPSEFTSASMPLVSQLKDKKVSLRICIDPLPEEIVRAIDVDGKKLGGEPMTEVMRRVDALMQPVRVEKLQDQTELLLKPVNRGAGPPINEIVPVAIDKVGGRHESIQAGGREGFFTYRYPVPLSEIARFEYRLKPYRHWVTFSNLSIHPGEKTDVRVKVESLVVTDSKKTEAIDSTPPKSDPESQYQTATYLQEKISAKIPDAAWGKPNKGLRLAMVIREQSNTDWNELPAATRVPASWALRPGDQIHSQLVVENVSDKPINLTGYTYSEVDRSLEVFGRGQKQLSINATHIDILPIPTSWKLLPGERYLLKMPPIAFLDEKSEHRGIGYYVRTPPGEYTVRCGYAFGQRGKDDPRPAPDPSEWTGVLQAGDIKVTVDDPNDKTASRVRRGQDALDRIDQFKPAWGELRSGVQMGLARLGETDKFRAGQRVPLEFYLRNAGKQTAKIRFHVEFYSDVPTVRDADGKEVKVALIHLLGARALFTETLKPGEAVAWPHWGLGIGADRPAGYSSIWHPFVVNPLAGTYTVSQDLDSRIEVEGSSMTGGGLKSGTVKFEIVVDPVVVNDAGPKIGAASVGPTVTGTLVGLDGKPVAGIEIVAFEGQKLLSEKFTTDERGQFQVPKAWRDAEHMLTAVARDGKERFGWFDFFLNGHSDNGQKAADGAFKMVLLPLDRTVSGRLVDPDGNPLDRVSVQIEFLQHAVNFASTSWPGRKIGGVPLLQSTMTDEDGKFELKVPAEASGTLRMSSVEWVGQRIPFKRDEAALGDTRAVRAAKVAGQVIDSRTGKPVAAVSIGAQALKPDLQSGGWGEATTNQDGRYVIGGLPGGDYNILLLGGAEKTLTAAAHDSVRLKSAVTLQADFALIVGKRLSGRVVDEKTGQPIAGCYVGYQGTARPQSGGAIEGATTNAQGEFELFVPPGKSHVYVADARETGADSQQDVEVPQDRDPEPVTLKAGPKDTETGKVKVFIGAPSERLVSLKANRMPLQDALTELCRQAAVKLELDGDGLKTQGYTRNMPISLELQNEPLGDAVKLVLKKFETLDFTFDKDTLFVSAVEQVKVRKEKAENGDSDSDNKMGAISGTLMDDTTGMPVADAVIGCQLVAGKEGKVPVAVTTDPDGKYLLKEVPIGIYNVWVKKYDANPKLVAAADQGIEVKAGQSASSSLRLVEGRLLRGMVVNRGKPVEGEQIGCYSAARPQSTAHVQSTKSAADGSFEFLLPPGPAHVYTMSGGFTEKKRLYASENAIIPAKGDVPQIMLQLTEKESLFGSTDWVAGTTKGTEIVRRNAGAYVSGVVVDPDGKPIPKAVLIKAENWDERIWTDDKGEFHLKVDRGTQFVFAVHAPGFNVWTGTPTTGDVLKIVLEPKQR